MQQNGAQNHLGLDHTQKHQQLSQLLSSSSAPSTQTNMNNPLSLQQQIGKVSMVNSLPSGAQGAQAMIASMAAQGNKSNDLLASQAYSMGNTSSSSFSMGLGNHMNKSLPSQPLTNQTMTSQALLNNTNPQLQNNMQQNLLNGPHNMGGLPGPGGAPRGPVPGQGAAAPSSMGMPGGGLQQASMAQGNVNNMANPLAAGQLGNNQLDMNHPLGNSTASAPNLMPVS